MFLFTGNKCLSFFQGKSVYIPGTSSLWSTCYKCLLVTNSRWPTGYKYLLVYIHGRNSPWFTGYKYRLVGKLQVLQCRPVTSPGCWRTASSHLSYYIKPYKYRLNMQSTLETKPTTDWNLRCVHNLEMKCLVLLSNLNVVKYFVALKCSPEVLNSLYFAQLLDSLYCAEVLCTIDCIVLPGNKKKPVLSSSPVAK